MNIVLTEAEARVLGALVEKEITTPEYYPLSLNALVNACNQKSNRDPVMSLDEQAVREALASLKGQGLSGLGTTADSRVAKYEHRLAEVFNFTRPETAILCELLLRGPQTPGELRSRAERMHRFDDLSLVQSTLHKLMEREPALVKVLPRQPGRKEARYAHLLAGDVVVEETVEETRPEATRGGGDGGRVERLEERVAGLEGEVAEMKRQLAEFRKQFE
ncbi:MAG: YceH family protein [Acidobacteriia bacterium]|nr:YceH family protein [Terriglobia bacterium]